MQHYGESNTVLSLIQLDGLHGCLKINLSFIRRKTGVQLNVQTNAAKDSDLDKLTHMFYPF